ncbi:hypothetical protein [Rufibacter sp. XAAS-G3-1]|uniref:hypothetical protein n=1 Tax=Rufibacter sp. XAAS-G3-1 TaxID=2729134 RepID=UPI0015E6771B|nr:hypothetical protein [Rufibacter sp. XAAS-G3-1]
MKNIFLLASICLLGFASCKSATCPAYSQKSDRSVESKAMAKAMAKAPATNRTSR